MEPKIDYIFAIISNIYFLLPLTLFTYAVYVYMEWKNKNKHLYDLASKIPQPDNYICLPIVGHGLHFLVDPDRLLPMVYEAMKDLKITKIWFAHHLYISVCEPEDLKIVLNSSKCLAKGDLYRFVRPFLGDGLLISAVPKWKKQRKLIMPTFSQKTLESFVVIMSEQANILVNVLESEVGKMFDVFEYNIRFHVDIFCETALSVSVNAQTTKSKYVWALEKGFEISVLRVLTFYYHSDTIFNWSKWGKIQREVLPILRDFTEKIVVERRKNYQESKKNHFEAPIEDNRKKVFLDLLLELSDNSTTMTNEEIIDEVDTFMAAGSDTCSTVLSFILTILGIYKDVQQKCYEESINVLGPDRAVEATDLSNFIYIEKVIKETMRLFPVGPITLRKLEEDMELSSYTIPKGATLALMIGVLHRSPKYYKDPLKFDPERFTPEEVAKRHRYAYLPFSGGPRNCIGAKLAMMSLKTSIATILRRYSIESGYSDVKDIGIKQSFTIKAVNGYPIRIARRN